MSSMYQIQLSVRHVESAAVIVVLLVCRHSAYSGLQTTCMQAH